jgi:type IX secretion system substrate protein/carboxypeptidase family protein
MKRILFIAALITSTLVNAQDNWQNTIPLGFNHETVGFTGIKAFNNKLYIVGDSTYNSKIFLYATATGDTSAVLQTGLNAVLQGGNETNIASMVANSNYLFLGSGISTYTTGAFTPQVYRYDATNYEMYGAINSATLTANNAIDTPYFGSYSIYPSISNMALYSPTGSNDTLYAFLTPGTNGSSANNVTIWKAPATLTGTTTPTWVNTGTFAIGSGITTTYAAKVWNKKLYLAVNSADSGGMILRTGNGVTWDTVFRASSTQSYLANGYSTAVMVTALEIYQGKLVAGLSLNNGNDYPSGGYSLWYTADSVAATPTQAWTYLTDSRYSGTTNGWNTINDLKAAGGFLWVQTTTFYNNPQVYHYGKLGTIDTLLESTQNTNYEAYSTNLPSWKLEYFNGDIYSSGTTYNPEDERTHNNSNHNSNTNQNNSRNSNHNPLTGAPPTYGSTWRFDPVNPTPVSFVDSAQAGSGFCMGNTINLYNTSTNGYYAQWYIPGITMHDSLVASNNSYNPTGPCSFYPGNPGTYTLTMVTYNGLNNQSIFVDSVTQTIIIHPSPTIVSATSSFTTGATYCQGQPVPVQSVVSGGTAPYKYTYTTQTAFPLDTTISVNPDTTVILSTVTTGTPDILSLAVSDANNCIEHLNSFTYFYVTAGDSLSGLVTDSNSVFINSAKVYLFQKKTINVGKLDTTLIDSLIPANNGKYTFPNLSYGSYYIKAVADTNIYHTSAGTYYADSTNIYRPTAYQWDSALIINHHTCHGGNDTGFNIKVIQITTPTGTGKITGSISQGGGYGMRLANNGNNSPYGVPLKGVDVKLGKNPGGGCAARTTSDSTGSYTFNNVNTGNYNIFVDIPNYGMDSVRLVTISPTNTISVNNNYYVDSTMIRVLPTNVISASICHGDTFVVGNHRHDTAGVFLDTLQTANLHDSLVILTLTVNALPTLTVTASNYTICTGNTTTLTVTGAITYTWSTSATTVSISPTPTVTTTYTVTGINGNGCQNKLTQTIMVNPLPIITVNSPTVCAGQSINLSAMGGTTYSWSGPNVYTSTSQNPIISNAQPTNAGSYNVTVTDSNGCVNANTAQVYVNPMPNTGVTIIGLSVLTASATPASYQWIDCNNSNVPVSGAINQTYTSSVMNGLYAVIITQNNCTDTSTCYLTNPEGIAVYNNNNNNITIYPNPNNGMFSIETSYQTQCNVFMYDVNGKLVLSQTIVGKTTIDASSLNEGVYNISIINKDGVANKRLVITR